MRVVVVSMSGLVRNVGKTIAPPVLGPLILVARLGRRAASRCTERLAFAAVSMVGVSAGLYLIPLVRSRSDPVGAEP